MRHRATRVFFSVILMFSGTLVGTYSMTGDVERHRGSLGRPGGVYEGP